MASHTGLRVVIVDDNEMTRALLRIVIQGDACTVVGDAGTAEAAMRSIAALRPTSFALT